MLVTHVSPDFDAITSCWLLSRFGGLVNTPVAFVNTGAPDAALLAEAEAVVDTGREYDPARLRFDHHQFLGAKANERCAAALVYEYLITQRGDLAHLAPLIALVNSGDAGRKDNGAEWSRSVGIHALLSAQKARKASDTELLAWGYGVLDDLATGAKVRADAARLLELHTLYKSADGLVWAINNAPPATTHAAFEAGARLVVFRADNVVLSDGSTTHTIGVQRAGEWQEPHCGALVGAAIAVAEVQDDAVAAELTTWFRHPAGFFAGRGTAKAPRTDPILCGLAPVAAALDLAWER